MALGVALVAAQSLTSSPVATAAPPKLTSVFPTGVERGRTQAGVAAGEFAKWPVQWHADRPGLEAVSLADKGKVELRAAADAVPGWYWLRAVDAEGVSAARPVFVGTTRELEESEPNDAVDKAQAVELPAAVSGKIAKAGDVDGFLVVLKAGEWLHASVEANQPLGAPMDAVLQIAEVVGGTPAAPSPAAPSPAAPSPAAPSGTAANPGVARLARRAEAFVLEQRDDETGLDPRFSFRAPRDGRYLVRVFAFPSEPNSTVGFAGADTYVYRLTLATAAFVDFAWPLARPVTGPEGPWTAESGAWTAELAAPAGSSAGAVSETTPATRPDSSRPAEISPVAAADEGWLAEDRAVSWVFHPAVAGAAPIPWTNHAGVRSEAAAYTVEGQAIPVPVVISGRLPRANTGATFRFDATKGQRLRFKAEARALGFPLDAVLEVRDASGAVVAEIDDASNQRDPLLAWTAPADGVFRVSVRDAYRHGGPRYAFRLTVEPITPDYGLTVANDTFVVGAGKTVELPVTIDRRDGFSEEIEIQASGLPEGVVIAPAKSENKGDTAKAVKLMITAAASAKPDSVRIQLSGMSTGPLARRHRAMPTPAAPAAGAAGSPSFAPRELWLTITGP
jgi:hypothetical protein